jgi:hypothetical protein
MNLNGRNPIICINVLDVIIGAIIVIDKTVLCQVIKKETMKNQSIRLFVISYTDQITKYYFLDPMEKINLISNKKDYILINIDDTRPANLILVPANESIFLNYGKYVGLRLPQNELGMRIRSEFKLNKNLIITSITLKNSEYVVSYSNTKLFNQ